MSLETISSVDINFSNGGGEHTANITSFLDVKNTDGTPSLGIVNGEIGSKNYFSQDEINKIMERFICTSISKSKSPVGTTVSRKYSDKTSMTLKSYVVLVRGLNAPPDDTDEYEGMFPFFSEVKGSPLNPFPSVGIREIKDKRVIVAGKIYNYESTTVLSGLKVALVYQNGQLVNDLCINADTVTEGYKNLPNLSSYGLKFGYTLNEYIDILNYVGITHKGLEDIPNKDKILFQVSGSLADITSAIASFFGFYYFIDPNTGFLNFIDSNIAANISITDYTQTTNENIVSATFSEEKFAPEIVNTYVGSTDKQGAGSQDSRFSMGEGKERNLAMFNVEAEKWIHSIYQKGGDNDIRLSRLTYASYFSLFANKQTRDDTDLFDKYTFLLMLFKEGYGGGGGGIPDTYDFKALYRDELFKYYLDRASVDTRPADKGKHRDKGGVLEPISAKSEYFSSDGTRQIKDERVGRFIKDKLKVKYLQGIPSGYNRTTGRLDSYIHYLKSDKDSPMKYPSETPLYGFLKGFFEFAGGIYVSSAMGVSDLDELDISNSRGLNILGIFNKNDRLVDKAPLQPLGNWLNEYTRFRAGTVGELAAVANQLGEDVGDFHVVGIKPWATLDQNQQGKIDKGLTTPLESLKNNTEFLGENTDKFGLGHDVEFEQNGQNIFNYIRQQIIGPSNDRYEDAIADKKLQLQLTYRLSKQDPQEKTQKAEEDRQLVGEAPDQEKLNDLLQRYDLKSYVIDAPKTEDFTPLSVQSASGSVVEMTALRNVSLKEYDSVNIKPLKSSSKTIYGLEVPSEFKVTTNSFSIKVASDGITTTIGESTLKLLPPDRQFMISLEMEAFGTPSINPRLKAAQRNFLGL